MTLKEITNCDLQITNHNLTRAAKLLSQHHGHAQADMPSALGQSSKVMISEVWVRRDGAEVGQKES